MHICSSCFREDDVVEETHDKNNESCRVFNIPREGELYTRFYCCGRVPPAGIYRKRHGMYENTELKKSSSIELAVEALENETGVYKKSNPGVPFIEDLPEELYQGRAIEVHGKLLPDSRKFSINLSTGKDNHSDLALHFNPRFDRRVIIRNHRIRGKWGVEEIASLQPYPFSPKRNFSVLIFVADEQFLIAVNKVHFCGFAFRIPVEKIKSLIVSGDIIIHFIQHNSRNYYPPQIFKKTPFIIVPQLTKSQDWKCNYRRKIKAIKVGSKIDIHGRVKILPRAFYVNLQKGIHLWPHPIIRFHMNYRLHNAEARKKEREIIFNSWADGVWGKEQILNYCPFLPGRDFHIKIHCDNYGYNVFVNDKYLFNFKQANVADVDSVVVHGDVIINKVIIH